MQEGRELRGHIFAETREVLDDYNPPQPQTLIEQCCKYLDLFSTKIILIALVIIILTFFNLVFLFFNDSSSKFAALNYPSKFTISTRPSQNILATKAQPTRAKPKDKISRLPKIFWIYTENQFDTESMNEQIYLYYFNNTAKQFGYETRLANSWNSYDWLSQQTIAKISKAMQNSKIDQPVHNILKLALLMENGGIILNQFDAVFLGQSFKWIEQMFEQDFEGHEKTLECQPSKSYLFMQSSPNSVYGIKYEDPIVAAVPNSLILSDAFELMLKFIKQGYVPLNSDYNVFEKNYDTDVYFIRNSFQQSINLIIHQYKQMASHEVNLCGKFGIQSSKANHTLSIERFSNDQKMRLLTTWDPEDQIVRITNLTGVGLLRGMNSWAIPGIVSDIMDNMVNNRNHLVPQYSPGSIIFRILHAPGNKQVFIEPLPQREIQLCVIIPNQLSKPQIDKSVIQLLSHQTYKKWKQIIFASSTNPQTVKIQNQKIILLNSSSSPVRNIEIAVTKFCQKQSYAVLINPGERFSSLNALSQIARAVAARDVVGAFITLDQQGNIKIPPQGLNKFHRGRQAIVNPQIHVLQSIVNHMRIFSVQSFRYIPQFDLRDIHGRYFDDRLIFLMTLLEMIRTQFRQARYFYIIKRFSSVWNIPRRAVFIRSDIKIMTLRWEEISREQLHRTRARLECEEIQESIHNLIKWKIPFSKMLAFNNGDQFTPVDYKKGPQIIPKVIHQVWLGNKQLPPAKKYFLRKTRMIYPNYEVKLWREENITEQNFPLTYEVLINLLQFNKHSPYNKLATVTDIIRHELLYHHGGFWKDAGMNLLRPIFDQFTKYKIVIAVDKTFRHRWLQGMCFFANAPKISNMWRITNYRNINRMRIYDNYASSIAGPIDFRQFVIGQEEYQSEILCMPYQTFYPAQVAQHPQKDLCTKSEQDLDEADNYQISENGWYLLSNCSELYPYSYAVQHNRFGDSWARRKQ